MKARVTNISEKPVPYVHIGGSAGEVHPPALLDPGKSKSGHGFTVNASKRSFTLLDDGCRFMFALDEASIKWEVVE
jgi:hypothetical protein